MEGEAQNEDIIREQNLPDMAHLQHVLGYDMDDVGKKTVAAIIYKYQL